MVRVRVEFLTARQPRRNTATSRQRIASPYAGDAMICNDMYISFHIDCHSCAYSMMCNAMYRFTHSLPFHINRYIWNPHFGYLISSGKNPPGKTSSVICKKKSQASRKHLVDPRSSPPATCHRHQVWAVWMPSGNAPTPENAQRNASGKTPNWRGGQVNLSIFQLQLEKRNMFQEI